MTCKPVTETAAATTTITITHPTETHVTTTYWKTARNVSYQYAMMKDKLMYMIMMKLSI